MNTPLIEFDNISKSYGKFTALDTICMQVKQGEIYGLIGKNGAGKTTLMRVITGLSLPSSGTISLFGQASKKELQLARKRIGCMIENPSIIPYMSAKENMQLHQKLRGIRNDSYTSILKHVGLSPEDKKKAKDFSLGMKQRLGIAISLLANPEILILDEPINGLDPVGVKEIRELLLSLCKNTNITILISSHNLPELYQIATQYIFIDKGNIIKTMSAKQLDKESNHHLLIGCSQLHELTYVLETILHTTNYKKVDNDKVELYDFLNEREYVSKTLNEHGITVTTFSYQEETLENYFLSLIGGIDHD